MEAVNKNPDITLEESERFLAISECVEFVYDSLNDHLDAFRFSPDKKMIYSGDFDGASIHLRVKETESSKKQLAQLIESVRTHKSVSYNGYLDLIDGKYMLRYRSYDGEDGIYYGVLIPPLRTASNNVPAYRRASDRDVMLDMLNKRAINEYAQKVCARNNCQTTYIIMFDLDNFKVVNDSYGHMFGDEVLKTVATIINKAVGSHGMVGRIGGDEIMIVMNGVKDKAELRPYMREIRVNVEEQFKETIKDISLTCSMGAAAYPDHGDSCAAVMDIADKMLYLAKEKGRNRYVIYTPEMHADLFKIKHDGDRGLKTVMTNNFNKVGIVHYMLEDYLKDGISSNSVAFANVGEAFHLKEVLMIYDRGKVGFKWNADGSALTDADLKWMELNEKFYSLFDENGMFIVDGLYDLEGEKSFLKEKFINRESESALLYRFKYDGEYQGFAMFVKKGQRQKWSEYELLALSTIGKVFELSLKINP